MRRPLAVATLMLALAPLTAPPAARAEDTKGTPPALPEYIDWKPTIGEAAELAKKENKPLFVAINAERVDGGRLEPAAKELRENTYRDPAVVAKSKLFVCALLRPDGTSADYAELRQRFSIDGLVVSPQHIFAHPDGTLIDRREYWPYGTGQAAVDAMLKMMDEALAAFRQRAGAPAGGDAAAKGDPAAQRAEWIRTMIERLKGDDAGTWQSTTKELVKADEKGDCIEPLLTVLVEAKKDGPKQVAILKGLGKPGLELVVPTVVALLEAKDVEVRSAAAVTLEYIGSARSVEPLTKRLPREKDDLAWNNVCRALGRCGAAAPSAREAVRKALVREMNAAKSAKTAAGPLIGLAYFEKDADAARAVEKFAAKEGDRTKRGYALWTLSEIKDPDSAKFVREEILAHETDLRASAYARAVASVIAGTDSDGTSRDSVERGMSFLSGAVGGVGGEARRDREQNEFKPKGEFARPPGFGPGGPGGGPGGAPGGPGMGG